LICRRFAAGALVRLVPCSAFAIQSSLRDFIFCYLLTQRWSAGLLALRPAGAERL